MANLHVDFTGDCAGLTAAAEGANRAIDQVAGRSAQVGITLNGADSAVNGLNSVQAARMNAGGLVSVGVDTRQVEAGRDAVRGLSSDVRQVGRDFDAVGGSRSIGVSDNGSLNRMGRDISALSGGLRGVGGDGASALGDLETRAQSTGRAVGNVSTGVSATEKSLSSLNPTLDESAIGLGNLASNSERFGASSVGAAEGSGKLEQSLGGVSTMVRTASADVENFAGVGQRATNALGNMGASMRAALPSGMQAMLPGPGGPFNPPPPGGGGGGGGRGFFGDDEGFGRSMRGGGLSMGGPLMMGAAVGLAEVAGTAAIGLMSVNAVTGQIPALSLAAAKAQRELGEGIKEGAVGAAAAGVPAYQQLGEALHGLGQEVGRVGAANIGQIINSEASLAQGATSALTSLAPAISPAISGMTALGQAVLQGISSPEVTQSIAALGNQLSTPQMTQGVANIVNAIATAAPYLTQGVAGAVADIGGSGQGASNVGTGWKTQPVGETVAENSGGFFSYDPNTDRGYSAPAVLPGGGAGVGWNQATSTGRVMTAIGSLLHLGGVAARDVATGSELGGPGAWDDTKAAWGDVQNRWSQGLPTDAEKAAGTAGPSQAATPSQLATAQGQAPFGWDVGKDGSLTPGIDPTAGGGVRAGLSTPAQIAAAQRAAADQQLPPSSPRATGGQGSGAPTLATAQALQQLNTVLPQTTASTNATANSIQQLGNQTPQALGQVGQINSAIDNSMSQAQTQIQSGAQSLGDTVPKAMADGIAGNQSAACAAAQQLGDGTLNCGKASVKAASPSQSFMELGGWISSGLAIGITAGAPQAVGAVQSVMGQVVAAGQAGVEAASPSQTFAKMGENAMTNVAGGVGNYSPTQQPAGPSEAQQRQDALRSQNAANMPQQRMADQQKEQDKAQQDQADQNSPAAKSRKAYEDSLQGRGFNDATNDRLMKRYDDQQKKALDAQKDRDKNQAAAMGVDYDPDSALSPHDKRAAELKTGRDKLKADAQKLASEGLGNSGGLQEMGQKTADTLRDGIKKNEEGPAKAAADMSDKVIDETKKKHGISSPSTVFHDIGGDIMAGLSNGITSGGSAASASIGDTMSGALGSGVTAASNGVMGIASNTGLAVGYQWGRSVVSGLDTVLRTADYQSISLPQIGSQLAKTALGDLGLLGPAGSGGSIPLNQAITMSSGAAAAPAPIQLNISLDGAPFRQMTVEQIHDTIGQLADLVPQQVG